MNSKKTKIILVPTILSGLILSACALAPVESDPNKASERFAKMAQDCYKRGGTWNYNVNTCVGADLPR